MERWWEPPTRRHIGAPFHARASLHPQPQSRKPLHDFEAKLRCTTILGTVSCRRWPRKLPRLPKVQAIVAKSHCCSSPMSAPKPHYRHHNHHHRNGVLTVDATKRVYPKLPMRQKLSTKSSKRSKTETHPRKPRSCAAQSPILTSTTSFEPN